MEKDLLSSVKLTYAKLQKIPRTEWPAIIASLTPHEKKILAQYLNAPRSSTLASEAVPAPSKSFETGLSSKKKFIMELPNNNPKVEGCTDNLPNNPSTIEKSSSIKCPATVTSKCAFTLNILDTHSAGETCRSKSTTKAQNEPNSTMKIMTLKKLIEAILFISGDGNPPLKENVFWVHSYLNSWISLIWYKFIYSNKNKSLKRNRKSNLQRFLTEMFPEEIARLTSSQTLIKAAHHIAKKSSGKNHDFLSIEKEIQLDEKVVFEANTIKEVMSGDSTSFILPPERFDYRLKFRDLRTSLMSSEQYQQYTSARSKSFKSHKRLLTDWMTQITSSANFDEYLYRLLTNDTSNDSFPFTFSNLFDQTASFISETQSWIFLISDRISAIVELADKIKQAGINTSEPSKNFSDKLISIKDATERFKLNSQINLSFLDFIDTSSYQLSIFCFLSEIDNQIFQFQANEFYNQLNTSVDQIIKSVPQTLPTQHSDPDSTFSDHSSNQLETDVDFLPDLPDDEFRTKDVSDSDYCSIKRPKIDFHNSYLRGDIYEKTKLEISSSSATELGLEGLWAKIVDKSEIHCRSKEVKQFPEISEHMLFLSIRMKELIWEHHENANSAEIFDILCNEWRTLINQSTEDANSKLNFSDLKSSIDQLRRYLDIAGKISNVFRFFSDLFPDSPIFKYQ